MEHGVIYTWGWAVVKGCGYIGFIMAVVGLVGYIWLRKR